MVFEHTAEYKWCTKGSLGTITGDERERHSDPIDLDFRNAFNSAGHSCLWVILRGLGVPDVDFLEDLFSNSCMKVQVGSEGTNPIQLDTGTVQGSVLSPLLFDLFLNALLRLLDATGILEIIFDLPFGFPINNIISLSRPV